MFPTFFFFFFVAPHVVLFPAERHVSVTHTVLTFNDCTVNQLSLQLPLTAALSWRSWPCCSPQDEIH